MLKESAMSLYDTKMAALDGTPDVLAAEKGKVTLMVNVASFCGLTPQYEGLQQLEDKNKTKGFHHTGTRPRLYQELTQTADSEGHTGDIRWNFEKFLVGRDGNVIARFGPLVVPEAPELVESTEKEP